MLTPLVFTRPTGRFVRFFLPASLRVAWGKRFVVRKLPSDPDLARIIVGALAVALSQATYLRKVATTMEYKGDVKDLLDKLHSGKVDEMLLEGLKLPNGVEISKAQFEPHEKDQFQSLLDQIGRVAPTMPVEPPVKASGGLLLSEAITTHLEDLARQALDDKTQTESRHTLKIFLGLTGDKPVADLKGDDCRHFLDQVKRYPKHATLRKEYKDLTPQQAIAKAIRNKEPEIKRHTLNKHFSRLNVFLESLVVEEAITRNPLSPKFLGKDKDAELETGRAFTPAELALIFGDQFLPWAKKYPHRYWVTILGLYTGARVNELSQLYRTDFEKVGDRWGFWIAKTHSDQKLKNKQSSRFIPLALPVLDLGFVDYLERLKTPRIFPHLPGGIQPNGKLLTYGRGMSRQFSDYIHGLGINEPHLGFHGFRHTFGSMLDRAGSTLPEIALITGHSDSKTKTVLETFYIESRKSHKGKINPDAFEQNCRTLAKFQPQVSIPAYANWLELQKAK